MKKLIILSALALMMNSCTKEDAESKAPTTSLQQATKKTFKTEEEGRSYLVSHFKPMAQELLQVTQNNKAFKHYVYTEVAKQFDGEDNVLLQTLLSSPFVSDLAGVIPHCSAFMNIDGQNLYPQIYIPFFNKANATNGKLPVIVLFDGD